MQPCVQFGCSVAQAWGVNSVNDLDSRVLDAWVSVYRQEGYLLVWREGKSFVVLRQGCDLQKVLLRAMWQAAWLEFSGRDRVDHVRSGNHLTESDSQQPQSSSSSAGLDIAGNGSSSHGHDSTPLELLRASIAALEQHHNDFIAEAQTGGWDIGDLVFKVGTTRVLLE